MKHGNMKYTDEELEKALIQCGGQPTKAAEMLGVDYSGVYIRIRKNPHLLEVQKSYRSKNFNDIANTMLVMAMAGILKEPETDEAGNVVRGRFKEIAIDYRTRMDAMKTLLSTFKSDEGIKEQLEITHKSDTIDYSKLSDDALKEILNAEVDEEQEDT